MGYVDGMFDFCEIFLNIWCTFKFLIFLQLFIYAFDNCSIISYGP
jgi:hypothetical protein